jgi:hypothetical protein
MVDNSLEGLWKQFYDKCEDRYWSWDDTVVTHFFKEFMLCWRLEIEVDYVALILHWQ